MSVEETTERLISILCEAAAVKEPTTYKTGFWGRAQVRWLTDDVYLSDKYKNTIVGLKRF